MPLSNLKRIHGNVSFLGLEEGLWISIFLITEWPEKRKFIIFEQIIGCQFLISFSCVFGTVKIISVSFNSSDCNSGLVILFLYSFHTVFEGKAQRALGFISFTKLVLVTVQGHSVLKLLGRPKCYMRRSFWSLWALICWMTILLSFTDICTFGGLFDHL